jgi:hypothetical protein
MITMKTTEPVFLGTVLLAIRALYYRILKLIMRWHQLN